jgi:hypothetical protein
MICWFFGTCITRRKIKPIRKRAKTTQLRVYHAQDVLALFYLKDHPTWATRTKANCFFRIRIRRCVLNFADLVCLGSTARILDCGKYGPEPSAEQSLDMNTSIIVETRTASTPVPDGNHQLQFASDVAR